MAFEAAERGRPAGSPVGPLYTATWGLLASIAALYLAALSFRPDLIAALAPPAQRTLAEGNGGQRSASMTSQDSSDLRERIAALSDELARTQAALESERSQLEAMRQRLAQLDEKATRPAAATAADAKALAKLKAAKAGPDSRTAATTAATATPPAQQAAQIETSSLGARPTVVNAPPARQPAASGQAPLALSLGGGPSLDALRLTWSLLSERHGTVLRSLAPRVQGEGTDDAPYQLLAGPVASPAEAERLCTALKARRISCGVATYRGDAL